MLVKQPCPCNVYANSYNRATEENYKGCVFYSTQFRRLVRPCIQDNGKFIAFSSRLLKKSLSPGFAYKTKVQEKNLLYQFNIYCSIVLLAV